MRNQAPPPQETEQQLRLLNTESMPSEFIDWDAVRRGQRAHDKQKERQR